MAAARQEPGRAPGPPEGTADGGDVLAARLSDHSVRWTAGGPLADWAPTYGPRHTAVATGGHAVKVALTRADPASGDAALGAWRRWQRQFVELPDRSGADTLIWWRLAVHQRVFAICAEPCTDAHAAVGVLRRIVRDASRLTVAFAHRPGQAVPDWVVHDHETPLFVGMPDYPLVGVTDRTSSLATLLRGARFHRYVHDIQDRGPARPPVVIAPHEADLSVAADEPVFGIRRRESTK